MYQFLRDDEHALYACCLSKGGDADEDFSAHVSEFSEATREAQENGRRLTAVLVMHPGHPTPSSYWRSKVSKKMSDANFNPLFAIVTANPAIRGVLTAISWGTKNRTAEFKVFSNEHNALHWLKEDRNQPIQRLQEMLLKVV